MAGKQIECCGESHTLPGWARAVGIAYPTLYGRLKKGWPLDEALTTPCMAKNESRAGVLKAAAKKAAAQRQVKTTTCGVCSRPFDHRATGTEKTTCSPACKKWWRSRTQRDRNRRTKGLGPTPCAFCSRVFEYAVHTRYCSNECRASEKRFRDIKEKYGIDRAGWMALFESQGRRCAICQTTEPGNPLHAGGPGRWATDHDHVTGLVRGILCSHCNTGLGLFRDNEEVFSAAIGYLRRGKQRMRLV